MRPVRELTLWCWPVRPSFRSLALLLLGLQVGLLTGCGGRQQVRFQDGPVIQQVHDNRDIPEPAEREFYRYIHIYRNFFPKQMRLGLDPVPPKPAADVNRLGEVPNSSWFENRVSQLTPAQVAQGPGGADPGPEPYLPWTVLSWKSGGRNPGFIFADRREVRYICKFDRADTPIVATAAGAVAARLLWACGYHVPDDRVAFFPRSALQFSAELQAQAAAGDKRAVTTALVDSTLTKYAYQREDGAYRVLVSRFLPGRPVGGYEYRGTRKDDPNDLIPHQRRRSLRGLRVFGAWLNHVDLKVDNTLDLYTENFFPFRPLIDGNQMKRLLVYRAPFNRIDRRRIQLQTPFEHGGDGRFSAGYRPDKN